MSVSPSLPDVPPDTVRRAVELLRECPGASRDEWGNLSDCCFHAYASGHAVGYAEGSWHEVYKGTGDGGAQ